MNVNEVNYLKKAVDRIYGDNNGQIDKQKEVLIFNEQLSYHAKGDTKTLEENLIFSRWGKEQALEILQTKECVSSNIESSGWKILRGMGCGMGGCIGFAIAGTLLSVGKPKTAGIIGALFAAGLVGLNKYCNKKEKAYQQQEVADRAKNINLEQYRKAVNTDVETMKRAPFLNDEKGEKVGTILTNNSFQKLDYAKVNDDMYELFMKKGDSNFEFKFSQTAENTFSGIMSKINSNGKSELYLTQVEYIDANTCPKMKVSTVRIVQSGVTDDSPYYIKEEKPRQITTTKENAKSHTERNESITNALVYLKDVEEITKEDSKNIEQVIREVRPEYKQVEILSV